MITFLAFMTAGGDITPAEKDKFELLYNRWKKLMLSKSYDILREYDLAQDAVSEAFIRVYKNLRKIDDPESGQTAAFLVMIVRNVSFTILKKQKKSGGADFAEIEPRADDFDLEQSVLSKQSAQELLNIIDGLSEDLKTPFLMKYAYEFSLKEIGGTLGITENNAAVRIHRARVKLAEMIRKGGEGFENG